MTPKICLCPCLILILLTAFSIPAHAAFLRDMPISITQPDKSVLDIFASGDEYHNWLHDKDNYTIIRDFQTGFYCYAEMKDDLLTAGAQVVGTADPSRLGLVPGINISEGEYKARRATMFQNPDQRDAPTTGTINNIVIYIRFSDETEFGQLNSIYDGWFNTGISSQKNYFLEASYNQLTVNTSFYPAPSGGYVVSWQDGNPRSYYQPYNATTNPGGYNGDTQRRTREFTLLQNATNGVSSQIPTGLNIDSDGDGRVDNVVYIVKGSAGEWSSLLWPHRWSLYDRYVYIHGKRVYDFNFQLQSFLSTQNVGVICHEFFHTLGAPDLYHYTGNGISPVGSWDLMESNTNPPQHMGAYMKAKYGDWLSIPTITADQAYTLNPLTSQTGSAYRINSGVSTQYYIVEFRKKTGTFENSLPGSGMLVYRIDTTANGNASGPPDEVYLYRPGGSTTVNGTVSSANYSLETGRTMINPETSPGPFYQNGTMGTLALYGIGSSAGTTMSFNKGYPAEVIWDFGINPYNESFDAVLFPPNGWQNQIVSGTRAFERVTSGSSPSCSPYAGAGMIRFNSYNASSGHAAYIATPRINVEDAGSYAYSTTFMMYRDSGFSTYADRIEVYLSSSQNLSGSPQLLGTINRSTSLAPSGVSTGWHGYTFPLPISVPGSYYVVLKAISAYGNNMFLDNFKLARSTVLPVYENFDGVTIPNLPVGFGRILSSSSSSAYVRTQNTTGYAASSPNYVQMTNSTDASADLRLVSPELTDGVSGHRIVFSARGGANGYPLLVGTMNAVDGAFTQYASIPLTTVHTVYDISFAPYAGTDKYIALKHGLGGTSRNIYLDDIRISAIPNRDLMVQGLELPLFAMQGEQTSAIVRVKNYGKLAQSTFQVRLMDADMNTQITVVSSGAALAPDDSVDFTLTWIPAFSNLLNVYAEVLLSADADISNNSSAVMQFPIYDQDHFFHYVGDTQNSGTHNLLPFNFYWKNSLSETIFTADEMLIPSGYVDGLMFHYSFVQDLPARPLKLWMKNTGSIDLSAGWLPFDGYTLVFDGVVDFQAGTGALMLPLESPFHYDGTNLALRCNRPMDTQYYNSANHFLYSTSLDSPNRSRYLYSDSVVYDPAAPSSGGTLSSAIPHTQFVISGVQLEAPNPVVSLSANDVRLDWDLIRGARSYIVFASDMPDIYPELPTYETSANSLEIAPQSRMFFKVKASTSLPGTRGINAVSKRPQVPRRSPVRVTLTGDTKNKD